MDTGVVFVYGTLMEGFWNYERYLKPYVMDRRIGYVHGRLYHLPQGYPALIDGHRQVMGELLRCQSFTKALRVIDELEGYYGPGNANHYERVTKKVYLPDEGPVEAFTYIYSPARVDELERYGMLVSQGDWRKYMERRRNEG